MCEKVGVIKQREHSPINSTDVKIEDRSDDFSSCVFLGAWNFFKNVYNHGTYCRYSDEMGSKIFIMSDRICTPVSIICLTLSTVVLSVMECIRRESIGRRKIHICIGKQKELKENPALPDLRFPIRKISKIRFHSSFQKCKCNFRNSSMRDNLNNAFC